MIKLIQLDVEKLDLIEHATLEIKRNYNRVDLLLNVAGILGWEKYFTERHGDISREWNRPDHTDQRINADDG